METEVETGSGGVGAGLRKGEFTGSIPFGTQPVLSLCSGLGGPAA